MAERWWQERWRRYAVEALLGRTPSESQWRAAAHIPAVVRLQRGQVTAQVATGVPGNYYSVDCRVRPLTERQWKQVLAALADDPPGAHRLLAGSPGAEVEAAFAAAGLQLFPPPASRLRCSCRDAPPCRHSLATLAAAGDLVASNPFLWLTVLGRERSVLQGAVRTALLEAETAGARRDAALTLIEPDALELDPARFWQTGIDVSPLMQPIPGEDEPGALLRGLGPLPLPADEKEIALAASQETSRPALTARQQPVERRSLEDVLHGYGLRISGGAAGLAASETDLWPDEHLPGKPVPAADRLQAEVQAALVREARVLSIEQLRAACPTAAAMPEQAARKALAEVLPGLPQRFTYLAGRYAAERTALRAGAVFRHVYTFTEWQRGCLVSDSDWFTTLGATGGKGPYTVTGHEGYKPAPGDEIWFTVTDPVRPALSAVIRRASERDLAAAAEAEQRADREAAALILRYMKERALEKLSEAEAAHLLLWEGRFRPEHCPRAIWLLHAIPGTGELHSGGTKRGFRLDRVRPWRPSFGRILSAHWPGFKRHVKLFDEWLQRGGISREERQQAITCVTAWCRFYTGPHEKPTKPAPLAAFLHFLWNLAPGEALRYGLSATTMPWAMKNWFTWCSGLHKKLDAAYQPHIRAAGLKDAFAHRLRTLPRGETAHLAWLIEGYRWMGPDHYYDR